MRSARRLAGFDADAQTRGDRLFVLTAFVVAVDLLLVGLHLLLPWLPEALRPLLDLDTEASVPAWYSSLKMICIGSMLLFLAYRAANGTLAPILLGSLGLLFLALSLDEIVGLHERAGFVVDLVVFDRRDTALSATGFWFVVLGVPVVAILALQLHRSSRILDMVRGTSGGFFLGAGVFFLGALVFEGLTNIAIEPATYHALVAAEEGIELLGLSIILAVMARCIRDHPLTAPIIALARSPVPPRETYAAAGER